MTISSHGGRVWFLSAATHCRVNSRSFQQGTIIDVRPRIVLVFMAGPHQGKVEEKRATDETRMDTDQRTARSHTPRSAIIFRAVLPSRTAEEKGDWLPATTTRVTAHGEASGPGACPLTGVAEGAVLRLARDLFETSHKALLPASDSRTGNEGDQA